MPSFVYNFDNGSDWNQYREDLPESRFHLTVLNDFAEGHLWEDLHQKHQANASRRFTQMVLNLMGHNEDPLVLRGTMFDEVRTPPTS